MILESPPVNPVILLGREAVRVGRLINWGMKVYRIVREGRDYGCFPGGRGVVEAEIELTDRPWPIFANNPETFGRSQTRD